MDESAARLIGLAAARGLTVAVAESLTGGAVTSALVDVPGASRVLRGGVVAYATDLKAALLGVPVTLLAERGAVDPEVACAMAEGVCRATGADLAVSTTGVAGPEPQDGRPVGLVYIGVASATGTTAAEHRFVGDRAAVRAAATAAAIEALLVVVEGFAPHSET